MRTRDSALTVILLLVTMVNLLILLANLGAVAVTLKMYTELFKDKAFDKRAKEHGPTA